MEHAEYLPDELTIALAHTPRDHVDALRIFFELDGRIGRIVGASNEVMLAQMRFAWWRDTLAQPVEARPQGDAILDGIGTYWQGQEGLLIRLVDGWEHMLAEEWNAEAASSFAAGRGAPFAILGGNAAEREAIQTSAELWALTDAALHMSDDAERTDMLRLASLRLEQKPLPRKARPLAILRALSSRSIKQGGRPLMEGRGAALTAIRAAIFGR